MSWRPEPEPPVGQPVPCTVVIEQAPWNLCGLGPYVCKPCWHACGCNAAKLPERFHRDQEEW